MKKNNQLTKRQHLLIDRLLDDKRAEHEILAKQRVSRATYERWQREPAFLEQFELRSRMAYRRSAAIIARHAPQAAEKLVTLATEGKGETARKACLDILTMGDNTKACPATQPQEAEPADHPAIAPEIADRLLAELAQEQESSKAID